MKNHLMLPMALAATLAIAACSGGATNPDPAPYTPPPPAADPADPAAIPPGDPAPVTSDPLPPLDPGI